MRVPVVSMRRFITHTLWYSKEIECEPISESLLYHQNSPWTKKNSDSMFDVTMGSYDEAETCELIGVYMPSLIASKFKMKWDSTATTESQYVRPRQEKLKKQSKKSAMFLNLTVLK